MSLQKKVNGYIEQHCMLSAGDTVICAVSGGADSLCLLHLLANAAVSYKKETEEQIPTSVHVRAVHVHHGIRGEAADADAAWVQKTCKDWGVPLIVRYVDAPALAKKEHIGLEDAARKLRYQILFEEAKKNPRAVIAVAHNRDDNAETLLMHLCRGAGIKGLAGIAPVKEWFESVAVRIIRPLLKTSRAEIEEYLCKLGITWCTDETNADTTYTRNAVRNELIPYLTAHINARAKEHIAEAAEHLREANACLERQADRVYKICLTQDGALDLTRLGAEDTFIQTEVLKRAYLDASRKICGGHFNSVCGSESLSPEHNHLESLKKLVCSSDGTKTLDFPDGITAERRYDRLIFHAAEKVGQETKAINTADRIVLPTEKNERVIFQPATDARLEMILLEMSQSSQKESADEDCDGDGGRNGYINPLIWESKDAFLSSYTNRLDYDKINEVLCFEKEEAKFRKRAARDHLLIAGGRHKTLKKYMIDDKIPACARDGMYVLATGTRVLWIPGFYTEPGLMASKDSVRVLELKYTK